MKKFIKTMALLCVMVLGICGTVSLAACGDNSGNGGSDPAGVYCSMIKSNYGEEKLFTLYKYVGDSSVATLDVDAAVKEKYGKDAVVERIKASAFSGNDTIKELIVPTTVKEIDAGAFAGMKKLEKITLPYVGATVVSQAYYGEIKSEVNLSADAARTFGYVFGTEEYSGGAQITIKYNAEDSGTTYYIPASLKSVTIAPKDSYNIPMYAFAGLSSVYSINFDDKVVGIGEGAFLGAASIKEIVLPASVTNIYKKAFADCANLKKITYNGDWSTVFCDEKWNDGVNDNFKVYNTAGEEQK